jgi:hypothetical protein
VVDTSNEIAGDGDIPHPAIGRSRRMQVAEPSLQHEVMIEAVENHMPEVIIIDEIGRELEAEAARTIAERGVQLVGTAHGNSLENLLSNPTLCDLIGGIDAVTLSDEEARRRGTQKTVLERKAPPTFDVLVEIQDRQTLAVHHDVAKAVDSLLRGRPIPAEIRYRDEQGEIRIETSPVHEPEIAEFADYAEPAFHAEGSRVAHQPKTELIRFYLYGISQSRLRQVAQSLNLPLAIVDRIDDAKVVLTLKGHYRKHPSVISEAERMGIPVYVLRSNTLIQMQAALADIYGLEHQELDDFSIAMREAQEAIRKVLSGSRLIELRPQRPEIRRRQHLLAREANLISHSRGREPFRRVRIYRE